MGSSNPNNSKSKDKDKDPVDPNVVPEHVQPFIPMATLPWEAPGQFQPMVDPSVMAGLVDGFGQAYANRAAGPHNLPSLPVSASIIGGDEDDEDNKAKTNLFYQNLVRR